MAVVLDSGFLIALERRDIFCISVVEDIQNSEIITYVPAGVLAQVWRGTARQHPISKLLQSKTVVVVAADEITAKQIGRILAKSGTSDPIDAHVALLAKELDAIVYTSDPDDIAAIDSTIRLVRV